MSITKTMSSFFLLLVLTAGIIGGIWFYTNKKDAEITKKFKAKIAEQKKEIETKKTKKPKKLFKLALTAPVFASFQNTAITTKPNISNEKINLEDIENLKNFKDDGIEFSEKQLKELKEYNFFIAKNNIIKDQKFGTDDFVDMYDNFDGSDDKSLREQYNTVFITSDVALHIYHKLVDKTFQEIEEKKFQPIITAITRELFKDSVRNYNKATNNTLKKSYKTLSVYYLIPLVILDAGSQISNIDIDPDDYDTFAQYLDAVEAKKIENNEIEFKFSLKSRKYDNITLDEDIYELANKELNLIGTAEGISRSPLFTPLRPSFKNDYSQFKPRSHYTKNNVLKSYFIAMMWYGRTGFTLNNPELTRDALIVTGQINNLKTKDEAISKLWSDISAVIGFFVGNNDDLTPYNYTNLAKKIYGDEITDQEIVNQKTLNNFISSAVKELPKPKIISEAVNDYDDLEKRNETLKSLMQFKLFGQRFTPDTYMLSQLTQGTGKPGPETGQKLPSMPTALIPISLLNTNNAVVKNYLDEWVNNNAPESDQVIKKYYNKLDAEFSAYPKSAWNQNIYWSWLNCFKPLLSDYQKGYPFFMTNDKWKKKNLNTVLGSYTELKHDTLLYSKQSYVRPGSGEPGKDIPKIVKGYVEPDLTFWSRLLDLAKLTQSGLIEKNIFPQNYKQKFQTFIDTNSFLKKIAKAELKNEKISDEDFEKLRTISNKFEFIVSAVPGQELTKKEKRAGIIADIHTDAVNKEILYEATGKPHIIYIAVKDINGTRLTRGAVFNHYEFTKPLKTRLTDEDWQKIVYDENGNMPTKNPWNNDIN